MFPETGRNIPVTIENYAFVDQFGRETVSWIPPILTEYPGTHSYPGVIRDQRFDDSSAQLRPPLTFGPHTVPW